MHRGYQLDAVIGFPSLKRGGGISWVAAALAGWVGWVEVVCVKGASFSFLVVVVGMLALSLSL